MRRIGWNTSIQKRKKIVFSSRVTGHVFAYRSSVTKGVIIKIMRHSFCKKAGPGDSGSSYLPV